jgi:hypothetical protein
MYKFIEAVQIYYRIVNNFAKTIFYEALLHFLVNGSRVTDDYKVIYIRGQVLYIIVNKLKLK